MRYASPQTDYDIDSPNAYSEEICVSLADESSIYSDLVERSPSPHHEETHPEQKEPNNTPTKTRSNKLTTTESKSENFTHLVLSKLRPTDSSKKWISCDICEYRTNQRYRIRSHLERCHMEKPKQPPATPFICDICGSKISTAPSLKIHKRIHAGIKPFPCLIESCDRRFSTTGPLTIHMRRHLGQKPYKCDKCSATFYCRYNLTSHNRNIHSDIRPFACDQCDRTFKNKYNLKMHQLIHSDKLNFQCDICGQSFRTARPLKMHMNVHLDIHPYPCRVCERIAFHNTTARQAHEKTCNKSAVNK